MCDIQAEIIEIGLIHVYIYCRTTEAAPRRYSITKVFLKFCKIHRETPVPEPFFN